MEITSKEMRPGVASRTTGSQRRIGQYQVITKIGQGGMGEVYRAHDAKLGRDVALKLLPEALAHDSQSLARLEREARTLASLNHLNIAVIFGLEESDGLRALVMELVEGETLSEHRSGKGLKSLPAEEALPIARQIAEALEYAHERGVIHRDLKPANVKITPEGTVKVLDFGLSKVLCDQDSAAVDPGNSPTLSAMATQAGMILGTAAYMPPEQAKGKQVDRRADIWAFGCVLFELLAGKKAFEGETISDVLAAVIKSDPDWTALPETTPPAIQRLLRRCLEKNVRQRLQAVGDARIVIEETLSGAGVDGGAAVGTGRIVAAAGATRLSRALPWALGAIAILFAGVEAWLLLKPVPWQNVIRFAVPKPDNADLVYGGETAISPDGRMLAFVAQSGQGTAALWLHHLDSLTSQPIPGTEGAAFPFWSPDSQWIGFEAHGKLEKIAVSGGAPLTLCDDNRPGATWNRDGVILFPNQGGLYSVPDTGGTPALVLNADNSRNEVGYLFPQFLPDRRHFLVEVQTPGTQPNYIGVGSLDSKTAKHLVQINSDSFYAPPGEVLYLDQGTLMARPFSTTALDFTGPAVPIAQNVGSNHAYAFFSISPSGVLAYQTMPPVSTNQMTWFNRAGQKVDTVGQANIYSNPALSPEGTRIAVGVGEHGKANIWVYDLKRGTASRLTFGSAYDVNPVWSPDGSQVFFSSSNSGPWGIYQKAADGLGNTQPVFESGNQNKAIDDLTADGRYAIYDTATNPATNQLWALPFFGDRAPFPFVQGDVGATSAKFSTNGRYVAYASSESGRKEVYVQTFPQHSGRWQISTSGGVQPIWRRDGKELFYLTEDEKLMAVDVNTTSATFQVGIPKQLFQAQLVPISYWRNIYVPSPDGQRFLMLTPAGEVKPEPITLVVNWPTLLKSSDK
jgi:Tol biopolymer transport system component